MRTEYTVTFSDFKAAQHLYRRRNRRARLTFIFWYRVMPIVGVAALTTYLYGLHHIELFTPWEGGLFAMLAWLGIFPVLWSPVQIRMLYRRMKEGHAEMQPVELEIDGNELVSRRPGFSEGRFRWAAIVEYAEDERIALLFVRKKLFLPVPRRALDEAGWTQLREWLGSKATAKEGRKPC